MMISPNLFSVCISVPFDFKIFDTRWEIFFARVKAWTGIFFAFVTCFLGMIIMCPSLIGRMSNTAMACLFSSIFFEGISPCTICLKISCFDGFDFEPDACCSSIASRASLDIAFICSWAARFCSSGRFWICWDNWFFSSWTSSGVRDMV